MPLPLQQAEVDRCPRKEGWLEKKSPAKLHVGASPWEKRYVVLHGGAIQYFKGTSARPKEVLKGVRPHHRHVAHANRPLHPSRCVYRRTAHLTAGELDLSQASSCELEKDTHELLKHFNLTCYDKQYRLRADSEELSKEWTDALNASIKIYQDLYELISKLNNVLCKLHMTHNRALKKEVESLVQQCQARNVLSPVLDQGVEILTVLNKPHQSIMHHDPAIEELRARDQADHPSDADPHLVRELSRIRERTLSGDVRRKTSKDFRRASVDDRIHVLGPLPMMLEED
jgi:hypothetical protein